MLGHVLVALGLALLFVLIYWAGETCRDHRWQAMRHRRGFRSTAPTPPASWIQVLGFLT